jgi:hypothetical protein
MGWWGVNVMEGDTPMDAECDIMDVIGDIHAEKTNGEVFDPYEDGANEIIVSVLKQEGSAERILASIVATTTEGDEYRHISLQVLGEIIVCNGGLMPESVREAAIQGAKEDEWAQEDEERKQAMCIYIDRIRAYDGTPLEPVSQGLFGKIEEALAAGEKGLINR